MSLKKLLCAESSEASPRSYSNEAELLSAAVAGLLGLPPDSQFIPTFSGSVAISRTFAAVSSPGKKLVITSPGFDSITSFGREATGARPIFVERDPFRSNDDWLGRLLESINPSVAAVMIVSPDNPTGSVLTSEQMLSIAKRCGECGTTMVVDQCFALINPFNLKIPLVAEMDNVADWCLLWDSSKTVELTGEKVGLVLPCGNLRQAVQSAFGVVHLDLPVSNILVVRRALERMNEQGSLVAFDNTIRDNIELVRKTASSLRVATNSPDAGSFILIGMRNTPYAYRPTQFAGDLLGSAGIAVAPSDLFYPVSNRGPGFIRASLARTRQDIEDFCHAFKSLLSG